MNGQWWTIGAIILQAVGVGLTVWRTANNTQREIRDLAVAVEKRPDRDKVDALLASERAWREARCRRHEERCEQDRQRIHDRLSSLAKRVAG